MESRYDSVSSSQPLSEDRAQFSITFLSQRKLPKLEEPKRKVAQGSKLASSYRRAEQDTGVSQSIPAGRTPVRACRISKMIQAAPVMHHKACQTMQDKKPDKQDKACQTTPKNIYMRNPKEYKVVSEELIIEPNSSQYISSNEDGNLQDGEKEEIRLILN